jgi:septal ring factor EnvC (AmiA/AmiB activator)
MPKSNRLAAGETKLCTSRREEDRAESWIPAFAGMASKKREPKEREGQKRERAKREGAKRSQRSATVTSGPSTTTK